MKLKAQSSKFKRSSKLQAPTAERVFGLGAWTLEFHLSFELWILSFRQAGTFTFFNTSATMPAADTPENFACGSSESRCAMTGTAIS